MSPAAKSPAAAREEQWSTVDQPWDVVVVGGGITGAGILRETARLGLRALLVEQRDFAWGASSRSSKLVHGGFRYLKEGKLGTTRAAVTERDRLLQDAPGLVDPLGFLLATYRGDHPGRLLYGLGLSVYDLLSLQWRHTFHHPNEFRMLAPHINAAGLKGGFRFLDARTDDARLVLRVITEAVRFGATALNYTEAVDLLRRADKVTGIILRDNETGRTAHVPAQVVINATGAWADRLRHKVGGQPMIRPLRGSHLIFPAWRLPVPQAVTVLHPEDRRPVFAFPWEGVTVVGTTDVDHEAPLDQEPSISTAEARYLLVALQTFFPTLEITAADVAGTYAGVRPVIRTGKSDPSRESRDHVVLNEKGLLTVTGGKLTTFRLLARDTIKALRRELPNLAPNAGDTPALAAVEEITLDGIDGAAARRVLGRYGADADALTRIAQPDELSLIPGTPLLWAEIRWAARSEKVIHLDDLLLRRTRVGLLRPDGGTDLLPRIRQVCQTELGWDHARWDNEEGRYRQLWHTAYQLPPDVANSPSPTIGKVETQVAM